MQTLKRYRASLIWSAVIAALMTAANYFANNQPLYTVEDMHMLYGCAKVIDKMGLDRREAPDAYFLNTAYDKALADRMDPDHPDERLGQVAVTDREKLRQLLQALKEDDAYEFILLDISFDKHEITEADSALYALIAGMDRIAFARSGNMPEGYPGLADRAGATEWRKTIVETNFKRLLFMQDSLPSLPLMAYRDVEDGDVTPHGSGWFKWYTSGGKLCHNSSFLTFRSKMLIPKSDSDVASSVYTLISDRLGREIGRR